MLEHQMNDDWHHRLPIIKLRAQTWDNNNYYLSEWDDNKKLKAYVAHGQAYKKCNKFLVKTKNMLWIAYLLSSIQPYTYIKRLVLDTHE